MKQPCSLLLVYGLALAFDNVSLGDHAAHAYKRIDRAVLADHRAGAEHSATSYLNIL